MGVKFVREHKDIIDELSTTILNIDNFYDFFEMSKEEWNELPEDEQLECSKTLADDIFFGLGEDPVIYIGDGHIKYLEKDNLLEVYNGDVIIKPISLV